MQITRKTKGEGILLEGGTHDEENKLADAIWTIVGEEARASRSKRQIPVLLTDWVDEEDVKSSLIQAGVPLDALSPKGISLRTNPGIRDDRVAHIDVPYFTAVELAEQNMSLWVG